MGAFKSLDLSQSSMPVDFPVMRAFRTQRSISAIEIENRVTGQVLVGALSEIPAGAQIELYGPGFNYRTVKAKYKESVYFVYMQDIPEAGISPQENSLSFAV